MYNLLMVGRDEYWEKNELINYEMGRIFQYTDRDVIERYQGPDGPNFDELKELPCLFSYEGMDVVGTIGRIISTKNKGNSVDVTYALLNEYPRITINEDEIFRALGIVENWEKGRTHWAVKDIDLFQFTTRMLYERPESQEIFSHGEMKSLWGDDYERKKLIFLSHRATDKRKVSSIIKTNLEQENIRCFVAHDDIAPGSQWQSEIIKALKTMDIFIGFVTDEFHEGSWTDQEIGYAYKRDVSRVFVKLGNSDPKGFIAAEQALRTSWKNAPQAIIEHLKDENLL